MKKYLSIGLLFLLSNEIISWAALLALAVIGIIFFVKAVVEYEAD